MDNFREKRKHTREPYTVSLDFTVLLTQESEFKRVAAKGKTVDKSPSGLGIITDFPLEAGHVLKWNDQDNRSILHLAMVRWSRQDESYYRAGLLLI